MDFLEIAQTRQSCRAYDSTRPVEPEKLNACLETARLAPSACNAQPYHITVAVGDLGQQVAAATRGMGMNQFTVQAPVLLVISEAPYNATASAGGGVVGRLADDQQDRRLYRKLIHTHASGRRGDLLPQVAYSYGDMVGLRVAGGGRQSGGLQAGVELLWLHGPSAVVSAAALSGLRNFQKIHICTPF